MSTDQMDAGPKPWIIVKETSTQHIENTLPLFKLYS